MRVVVAPDSMGGMLSAPDVADAVARGWASVRAEDEVATRPMSDGGEGLLEAVHRDADRVVEVEVAGPLGHPVGAWLSLRDDGTAVVESARACGLALLPPDRRDPWRTTTYGVGQLLEAARTAGARRVLVGLGGSATVEGGAGALTALGLRLRVADGSGLKVGAADLPRVAAIEPGWRDPAWGDVEVVLLADVRTTLADAATRFAPQKGATPEDVPALARGLARWAEVVAADLGSAGLDEQPGTGAAGGLGYGLAAALGGRLVDGAATVADLVGLDDALAEADVVLTGEGRLDATSFEGKVVGEVCARAGERGLRAGAVVGVDARTSPIPTSGLEVATAAATTPQEARAAAARAGATLARRLGHG
jgi:glycerate kinase